ncbi:MAG: hypothetical protein QM747_07900 [Nocardioides sp.]
MTIHRIGETLQEDTAVMTLLLRAGVRPGSAVEVSASPRGVRVGSGGEFVELDLGSAGHVAVEVG